MNDKTIETLNRLDYEMTVAKDGLAQYKQSENITALRKAYEAVNIMRNLIGAELKDASHIKD